MKRAKRGNASKQRRDQDFHYEQPTSNPKSSTRKKRQAEKQEKLGIMCGLCGKYLKNEELHHKHVMDHAQNPFQCPSCPLAFPEEKLLQEHEESHYETEDVFECPECLLLCKNKTDLLAHKRQWHKVKPERIRYSCPDCDKSFLQAYGLQAHMSIHTGEKPYMCKDCGAAFRLNSSLHRHVLREHIRIRPFECEHCEKGFAHESDLKRHVRAVHAPERSFVCQICDEAFTTKTVLMRHVNIHFQLKLNVCKICGSKFSHSGSLYNHMKVHSNYRAYKCDECGKSYKLKSHLTHHTCVIKITLHA